MSGLAGTSSAATPESAVMVYSHGKPESPRDDRQLFVWEVLREALERTRGSYGDYEIREASIALAEKRQFQSLSGGNREINIAVLPVRADDRSPSIKPVRIPVMGGLLGYRVMLERRASQSAFDAVRTLEDLRGLSIGQAWFWPDAQILAKAGLTVVTGDSYEGLFKMLAKGRFDGFSRGITEIVPEYEARKDTLPDLAVEAHLLLHYPMPEYFWFSDDATGRRLAQRVRQGLQSMVADHSLCRMAEQRFDADFRSLELGKRTLIEIPSDLLGPEDHLDDPAYWCIPSG